MKNDFRLDFNTRKFIVLSGIIGNFLEQYDVMICAFLSHIIATTFFPSESTLNNLFYTFYVYLAGYLSRPIGSLIIGLYADQLGRKKALIFSIILVGVGTSMIGLIPSYNEIGILSTIFFIVFRILQNVSAGGEYISSIAYVIESGGLRKRGFYGSWVAFGLNSGTLVASLTVFAVSYLINENMIPNWSWRLIFLSSILSMLVGLWIRYSLPESAEFILENSITSKISHVEILKSSLKIIKIFPLQCFSLFIITLFGVYTSFSGFIYLPLHLSTVNNLTTNQALGINTLSLIALLLFIPIFGILGDYINRIKLLIFSTILIAILALPCFWFWSFGGYMTVLFFKILFSVPSACYFSIAPIVISETFPIQIRCTSIALIYQIAASLAAGLTPLLLLMLVKNNSSFAPAILMIISAIIGIFSLSLLYKNKTITINLFNEKLEGHILKFPTPN